MDRLTRSSERVDRAAYDVLLTALSRPVGAEVLGVRFSAGAALTPVSDATPKHFEVIGASAPTVSLATAAMRSGIVGTVSGRHRRESGERAAEFRSSGDDRTPVGFTEPLDDPGEILRCDRVDEVKQRGAESSLLVPSRGWDSRRMRKDHPMSSAGDHH